MILQSCPLCGRPYDVRHLEPGNLVRCACDVEFTVEHARELRERGKRCGTCGGSIPTDAEDCPYCGTGYEASETEHTLCPSCFARVAVTSAHCRSCGNELRPHALRAIPAGKQCPRCQGKLQIRSLDRTSLVECSACHGLWLGAEDFKDVVRDAERDSLPALGAPDVEDVRPASENLAYIPCLDCDDLMLRQQFKNRARPTGVVVDYCRDHGVWLDGGELESIVRALRTGSESAPDVQLVEAALRPRIEVRTFPEGGRGSRRQGSGLVHALGQVLDELVRVIGF